MRFSVRTNLLSNAMHHVSEAKARDVSIYSTGKKLITLVCENSGFTAAATIRADVEEEGTLVFSAGTLNRLLGPPGYDKVTVFVSGNDVVVQSTGKVTVTMTGLPKHQTVHTLHPPRGFRVSVAGEALADAVGRVIFSCRKDDEEGRWSMHGIRCTAKDGKLRLQATDGFRLSFAHLPYEGNGDFDCVVEKRLLEAVVSSWRMTHSVQLNVYGSMFYAATTDEMLSARVIPYPFPDTGTYDGKETDHRVTMDRKEFLAAVQSVAVFAPEQPGTTDAVALSIDGTGVTASVEDVGLRACSDSVYARLEGAAALLGFNAQSLVEPLQSMEGSNVVLGWDSRTGRQCNAHDAAAPVILRDETSAHVIQPLFGETE